VAGGTWRLRVTGLHLIVGAEATRYLHDRRGVEDWVRGAADMTGMTIIGMMSHLLPSPLDSGPGVSVNATIAESHIAVHSWPEEGTIRMDFYSCRTFDAERVFQYFCEHFGVTKVLQYRVLERA
jgi:S-adenosylmethionine decarboxylase